MDNNTCSQCAHYFQHYALDKKKLFRVFYGHCAQNPPRAKRPYNPACGQFSPAPPDEDAFATKEYLSKELLQYLLNLELLPKIEDTKDR